MPPGASGRGCDPASPLRGWHSLLLAATKVGCTRRHSRGLLGPGSAVLVWRWPAPPSSNAVHRDPICRPGVAAPCAQTCHPPQSALVVTLCGVGASSSCACGLAAGMLAVGLRDRGVPTPDPASSRLDLVELLMSSRSRGTDSALAVVPSTRAVAVHAIWPRASLWRGCVSAGALPRCLSLGRAERRLSSTMVSAMLVPAAVVEAWWRHRGVSTAVRMKQTMPFVALSMRAPARVLDESSAQP